MERAGARISAIRDAWLAICGLAPGKQGANRTGRPFTGDFAGLLLYETLLKFGLAEGALRGAAGRRPAAHGRASSSIRSNACRRRTSRLPEEIATCARTYFQPALAALPNVRVLVALGQIAHGAAVRAVGGRLSAYKFGHLAEHRLPDGRILIDSYHCSRYNQNTSRLTARRCSRRCSRGRWSSRRHPGGSRTQERTSTSGLRSRLSPG